MDVIGHNIIPQGETSMFWKLLTHNRKLVLLFLFATLLLVGALPFPAASVAAGDREAPYAFSEWPTVEADKSRQWTYGMGRVNGQWVDDNHGNRGGVPTQAW